TLFRRRFVRSLSMLRPHPPPALRARATSGPNPVATVELLVWEVLSALGLTNVSHAGSVKDPSGPGASAVHASTGRLPPPPLARPPTLVVLPPLPPPVGPPPTVGPADAPPEPTTSPPWSRPVRSRV